MLFGSAVKGELRPDSDIDLLIITDIAEKLDERDRAQNGDCEGFGRGEPIRDTYNHRLGV